MDFLEQIADILPLVDDDLSLAIAAVAAKNNITESKLYELYGSI